MLKITIHNKGATTHFILEGRLKGEWVKELECCWHQATAKVPPQRILVELRDVRSIDEEGRELLRLMAQRGAELIAIDLVMKAIIKEIVT